MIESAEKPTLSDHSNRAPVEKIDIRERRVYGLDSLTERTFPINMGRPPNSSKVVNEPIFPSKSLLLSSTSSPVDLSLSSSPQKINSILITEGHLMETQSPVHFKAASNEDFVIKAALLETKHDSLLDPTHQITANTSNAVVIELDPTQRNITSKLCRTHNKWTFDKRQATPYPKITSAESYFLEDEEEKDEGEEDEDGEPKGKTDGVRDEEDIKPTHSKN
ncbi:hypothetical protein BY996DRAFT_6415048 [Phakopsora pachyrhizi]|uniref:Expressed protein n=1 Tax=Phakopsora pachyrhizi TaxID=170000 RepID=A0AAV0BR37_PHAPC|nr:hypothetical protein BY996DRAFT_6415048 [Phakopsora pachyrhizi]CAH7688797.1 expressed protein [Phakopsora pachyrhizi]